MDTIKLFQSVCDAIVAMDNHERLSLISGIIFGIGFLPYIGAILFRGVKPEKTSWIIWTALDGVVLVGMCMKGTENFQIIIATGGAAITMLLALIKGEARVWTKLEKWCLGIAGVGIALSLFLREPTVSIVISGIVAVVGSWPTFKSAWNKPNEQGKFAWTVFFISCLFEVSAIKALTFAEATQPIVFLFVESVMMCLIFIQPIIRRRKFAHG